jgi:hypothetical protein
MQHSWTKKPIWVLHRRKWREWCIWFQFSYLITVLVYLASQLAPLLHIRYFMCDWSILRLFVLNTGWKRDSLQIIIFVSVCSTCSVVELKMGFETWITRNDVNDVYLCLLPYLITLMAYLCSQTAPNVLIKYFMFDWSIYRLFVLNTVWKHDFLQMMIFVYVWSTCSVVEINTRCETRIARNDLNGVYCFHLSYLITVLALVITIKCAHMGTKCRNLGL